MGSEHLTSPVADRTRLARNHRLSELPRGILEEKPEWVLARGPRVGVWDSGIAHSRQCVCVCGRRLCPSVLGDRAVFRAQRRPGNAARQVVFC